MFAISLIPMSLHYVMRNGVSGVKSAAIELWKLRPGSGRALGRGDADDENEEDAVAGERLLSSDSENDNYNDLEAMPTKDEATDKESKLSLRETARLSLEFCMLWFLANYFASACLEYTSVGSVTILTSTSSVWTLVFCATMGVEGFTIRKLIGVLASMAGVILISSVDLSGSSDENRGNFPHKTQAQIAIGDAMAFVSAIIYGVYVTVMKRKVGNEDRVNMPLFFGLVGLFNVLLLWPGFFILHFTGVETVSDTALLLTLGSPPLTELCSLKCLQRARSGQSSL
jgi:solute carrier family 35, member F5